MSDTGTPDKEPGFNLPSNFRGWALLAIIVWLIVGLGFILQGFEKVAAIVMPSLTSFLIAGLLIAIFRPVTKWLKAHGFKDGLAALGGVLAALIVIGILFTLFLGPVIAGAAGFISGIPDAFANLGAKLQSVIESYHKLPANVQETLRAAAGTLTSRAGDVATNVAGMLVVGASTLFSLGLEMFLAIILLFWFLKDGPRIAKACLDVVPESYRGDIAVIASSFDKSFSGYLLATAINCSIIFVLDGIGFTLVKLPNAWFVASMVAILGIIPYLGSILSFVVAMIVGLTISPVVGAATGLIVFTVDQIVYSFIGPIVAGKTVTLHPVMIILSLSIGAALMGFLGAIISIPIAAAIRVIYIYYRDREAAKAAALPSPAPEEA